MRPITRMYNADLYIDEAELARVAREVLDTIKHQLPQKYHCECIIHDIFTEAEKIAGNTPLNL